MRAVIALLGFAAAGCALDEFAVNSTAPALRKASSALAQENDLEFAKLAAPGALKTVEGFLESSPKNPDLLEAVARGYVEYTFGFIEDELEQIPDDEDHAERRARLIARATNFYDRAYGYGLRLLSTWDPHVVTGLKHDLPSAESASRKVTNPWAAPGFLFSGMALASSVSLNRGDMSRIADLPRATLLLERAFALDPGAANATAGMALGIVYCAQGRAMGGDPDRGERYMRQALRLTHGRSLMVKVMMARHCAVARQDRETFESTLREVLATRSDENGELRLANELARRRAARYLKHVEDYF